MPGSGTQFWADVAIDLSTYFALASAFFFARPVLRNQHAQANLITLEASSSSDPRADALRKDAVADIQTELASGFPKDRRDNRVGIGLLVVSGTLLTIAIPIHIFSLAAAVSHGPAETGAK
jgi:hypothetical protein